MQPVFYRVTAVEGRQVVVLSTVRTTSLRRVGHKRIEDGVVTKAGKPEPRVRFVFDADAKPELVEETRDRYYARRIEAGDLDYVESVTSPGAKDEKAWREPALVRATAKNKAARAEEAKRLAAQKKVEADALDLDLLAAEEGLTVEELKSKSAPKAAPKADKSSA